MQNVVKNVKVMLDIYFKYLFVAWRSFLNWETLPVPFRHETYGNRNQEEFAIQWV